jgi:sec-independent protein translocase protein TatC
LAKKTESPEITPGTMPIMSHLRELRDRIFKSGIAIVIGTAIGFIFCPQILKILIAPAGDMDLQAIELVENLAVYFKVSLAAGIIITMPFLVYQGIAYIAPALTAREKGIVYRILPAVTVMFLGGIAFAYYVALPPALNFLKNFMSNIAETQFRISDYINIVTRLIVAVGMVFETPIIIMLLARMGIVSPQWLARRRRMWIVVSFIIAAIITPTFDPINQSIIAIPLIILMELSIILARFVYKKRGEAAPAEA